MTVSSPEYSLDGKSVKNPQWLMVYTDGAFTTVLKKPLSLIEMVEKGILSTTQSLFS